MVLESSFIWLLETLVDFLKSVLTNPKLKVQQDGFFGQAKNDDELSQQLREAYKFMELEPPIELGEVKKRYKRLSRMYHPDRNIGNEDAVGLMQKLNTCMDLIQDHLEKDSSERDEPSDWDYNENQEKESMPTDPMDSPFSMPRPEQKRKHRNKKKAQRSAKHKKRDAMRQQMKEELQQEQKRQRQLMKELRQKRAAVREHAVKFTDHEQKEATHSMFNEKLQMAQEGETFETKPKNLVMQSCEHDWVVALRMDNVELLMDMLNEQLDDEIQPKLRQFERLMRQGYVVHITEEKLGLKDIRAKLMTQDLDADGNTLLHYAVYFEASTAIRCLCHVALDDGHLETLVLRKNKYGQVPMVYAHIAKDPTLKSLMQSQHDLVSLQLEKTRAAPAMRKAGRQLWSAVWDIDMNMCLSTTLGFLICQVGFRLHLLFSFGGIYFLQVFRSEGLQSDEEMHLADVSSLLSYALNAKLLMIFLSYVDFKSALPWVVIFASLALLVFLRFSFLVFLLNGLLSWAGYVSVLFYVPLSVFRTKFLSKAARKGTYFRSLTLAATLSLVGGLRLLRFIYRLYQSKQR